MKKSINFRFLLLCICLSQLVLSCDKDLLEGRAYNVFADVRVNNEMYHHYGARNLLSDSAPEVSGVLNDYSVGDFRLHVCKKYIYKDLAYKFSPDISLYFFLDTPNKRLKVGQPIKIVYSPVFAKQMMEDGLELYDISRRIGTERITSTTYGEEGVCLMDVDNEIISLEGFFTIQSMSDKYRFPGQVHGIFSLKGIDAKSRPINVEGVFDADAYSYKPNQN